MNTEKEFVPYKEALKLKELGFNEPCLFAFDNCSTPMRCSNLRTNEQKFNGVNYNSSTYTSQPTFSQTFRWFRENYKLISNIEYQPTNSQKWGFLIYVLGEEPNYEHWFYETYEQTELECLRKLIKIVKNK